MASDGIPGRVAGNTTTSLIAKPNLGQVAGGKVLPQGGNPRDPITDIARHAHTVADKAQLQAQLSQLNKYLNDSGRPNQFRIDPASRDRTIQEVNPATGEVIGEFATDEFPALARSLGASGVLVDSRA